MGLKSGLEFVLKLDFHQTAPTAVFDSLGKTINELERNREGLLVYEFENMEINFGQKGIQNEINRFMDKT